GARVYTIAVRPALAITTSSPLPNGTIRASYSVTFSASGGWPAYSWTAGSELPAGLTINPTTGVLRGAPAATRHFTFTITVTDSAKFSALKSFSLAVQSAAQLQTSAGSFVFSSGAGGDSPVSQSFLVTSSDQSAARFSLQVDGGAPNTAAPPWISVQPRSGATPARISVVLDSTGLRAAAYSARVLVISADGAQSIALPITFNIDGRAPALEVIPDYLRLSAAADPTEGTLLIRNSGGGGPITFLASVPDSSGWLTVEPASGTTSPNTSTILRVVGDPSGLARDVYRGVVRITSHSGSVDVPVVFLLPDGGPALAVSQTGVRFDTRQAQGAANGQSLNILNIGDGSINWTAELVSGQEWLTLGAVSGQVAEGI